MAFLENNVMIERINALKKERGAVILAHNYELAEVQEYCSAVQLKAQRTLTALSISEV